MDKFSDGEGGLPCLRVVRWQSTAWLSIFMIMGCSADETARIGNTIDWKEFDSAAVQAHVEGGDCVFVFMHPMLSPVSDSVLDSVSREKLDSLCENRSYVAYVLKYDDWNDPAVRRFSRTIGFTKEPYIVFYPSGGAPRAIDPHTFERLGSDG